jgi:hypothetical protein
MISINGTDGVKISIWYVHGKKYILPAGELCSASVQCQPPLLEQPWQTCGHHLLSHDCKWMFHELVTGWYMPSNENG